jgi:hypothetical protein
MMDDNLAEELDDILDKRDPGMRCLMYFKIFLILLA